MFCDKTESLPPCPISPHFLSIFPLPRNPVATINATLMKMSPVKMNPMERSPMKVNLMKMSTNDDKLGFHWNPL